MPRYRIISKDPNRFKELRGAGDIIELDSNAAAVPLSLGELEPFIGETLAETAAKMEQEAVPPAPPMPFVCDVCARGFNFKVALAGHKRSHKDKEA